MKDLEKMMRLENVSLDYSLRRFIGRAQKYRALSRINLELKKGETLGVVGRNGCGKSSLLMLIAGVIDPTDGEIWIRKGVTRALLSLGLGFNRELSGRDNALLSAMLQGFTLREAKGFLAEIQEYSGLEDFFDQPVKTYSAGMRSKLGFSTAIKTNVDVLLIDETLSVGDRQFRNKAERTMLDHINGEQTVVFVSHQPGQIEKVCRHCIWLEKGEIVEAGKVTTVTKKYNEYMKMLANEEQKNTNA